MIDWLHWLMCNSSENALRPWLRKFGTGLISNYILLMWRFSEPDVDHIDDLVVINWVRCDAYHGDLIDEPERVDRSRLRLHSLGNSGTKHERKKRDGERDLTERPVFIHYIHLLCTFIHPHLDYPKICVMARTSVHMNYILYSRGTYSRSGRHWQSIRY
jgi:hypothetical protein